MVCDTATWTLFFSIFLAYHFIRMFLACYATTFCSPAPTDAPGSNGKGKQQPPTNKRKAGEVCPLRPSAFKERLAFFSPCTCHWWNKVSRISIVGMELLKLDLSLWLLIIGHMIFAPTIWVALVIGFSLTSHGMCCRQPCSTCRSACVECVAASDWNTVNVLVPPTI